MFWQMQPCFVAGRGALEKPPATAPINAALPIISGTTAVAFTLTTTDGAWTGLPPITYTYQWARGGVNIGGATSNSYLLVIADLTATITVTVTATNSLGNANATSSGVGPITMAPPITRSSILTGTDTVFVNTSAIARDANAAGVMINSR